MKQRPNKILAVDDNRNNLHLIKMALEAEGYQIECRFSGRDALLYLEDNHADLVLLDIMMPDMDGYAVLEYLRQFYSNLQLPIVMLTAKTETDDLVRAFSLGANDYLKKPLNLDEARARIETQFALINAEQLLLEKDARFELAISSTKDGIWEWDLIGNVCYFSPRWKLILGYREDEIHDQPNEWFDRVHPDDRKKVEDWIDKFHRGSRGKNELEYRMVHKNGSLKWVVTRCAALYGENGQPYRLAGAHTDITETKAYDHLTGLRSKHAFLESINRNYESSENSRISAVLVFGIDQFDMIRDSLEPSLVDAVLVEVGRRLRYLIYPKDIVARLGDETFAILCADLDEKTDAENIALRIGETFKNTIDAGGLKLTITLSVGVEYLSSDRLPGVILQNGIAALNEARRAGKGECCVFGKGIQEKTRTFLLMETDLRLALKNREFFLEYQPIVCLKSREIVSCEALIRWLHPQKGRVNPNDFIPVAEKLGLDAEIGHWVLQETCSQAKTWLQQHGPNLPVSVNFSYAQLKTIDTYEQVKTLLEQNQLPASLLKIEITENVLVKDIDKAVHLLKKLKKLGVTTALDDFGTGFSSLSYLKWLPIDILKIDKSFIDALVHGRTDAALTLSIIEMAKRLGMQTISEGVETLEQLNCLAEMKCDMIQGYYIARPMPANQLSDFLTRFKSSEPF